MTHRPLPHLRLHEWAFGLFLLVTAVRLLLVVGASQSALEFAAMAVAVPLVAVVATRRPGPVSARVRLLLFPVWVNLAYFKLGGVVAALGPGLRDAELLGWDRMMLGETPAMWLGGWGRPLLTEFLSACYMLFFPAVLAAFVVALLRPETVGVRLFNGLITIYAIGFLGYTLVPAAGPYLAMAELLPPPPPGGYLTSINAGLVAAGSNHVDVFPSLHTAIAVFLIGTLWPRHRRWFGVLLVPTLGLCAATLYLRYHYAVDLAAGLILAGCGWLCSSLTNQSHEPHPPLR